MVSRRMLSTPSIVRRGHLSLRNPRSHAWLGLGLGLGLVFLRGRCLAAGRCSDSSTSLSSRPCDATTTLVITHTPPVRRSKTGARAPSHHLEGHHAMDTMPPAVKHKGARRRQVHRPSHRRAARAAALRVRPGACFTRRSAQLRRGTVGRPLGVDLGPAHLRPGTVGRMPEPRPLGRDQRGRQGRLWSSLRGRPRNRRRHELCARARRVKEGW